jgi:hypothetical protein
LPEHYKTELAAIINFYEEKNKDYVYIYILVYVLKLRLTNIFLQSSISILQYFIVCFKRFFLAYFLFDILYVYLCTQLKRILKAKISILMNVSGHRGRITILPSVFNFDACGFEIDGTPFPRINSTYRGLLVVKRRSFNIIPYERACYIRTVTA